MKCYLILLLMACLALSGCVAAYYRLGEWHALSDDCIADLLFKCLRLYVLQVNDDEKTNRYRIADADRLRVGVWADKSR